MPNRNALGYHTILTHTSPIWRTVTHREILLYLKWFRCCETFLWVRWEYWPITYQLKEITKWKNGSGLFVSVHGCRCSCAVRPLPEQRYLGRGSIRCSVPSPPPFLFSISQALGGFPSSWLLPGECRKLCKKNSRPVCVWGDQIVEESRLIRALCLLLLH